jgi:hypothetical protein
MADSFRLSKGRKFSKRVNNPDSQGGGVSMPVHMFNYDLPLEASRPPEAVGLCFAAVPPHRVVRDWSQVTCKNCLRLEANRARSRQRRRNGR